MAGYFGGGGFDPAAFYQQQQQGYQSLLAQVMGQLAGVGQSQSQAIKDAYAQQTGQTDASLISSGLGNSTVKASANRGLRLDEQKAQIALSNQLAQLGAGYTSQIGEGMLGLGNQYFQSQLGYQNQSNLMSQQNLYNQQNLAMQQPMSGYLTNLGRQWGSGPVSPAQMGYRTIFG